MRRIEEIKEIKEIKRIKEIEGILQGAVMLQDLLVDAAKLARQLPAAIHLGNNDKDGYEMVQKKSWRREAMLLHGSPRYDTCRWCTWRS